MSLLKVNEVQNYNGSSLTLTASTVSTSAQLNTGGNISVTGSINVSDDSTTRSNLGLGSIATQDSDNVTVTGGTATLGALTVSGSDSGDLVRITQTGSGNAFVVEDSANPDSTPFVVDSSGNVGVGKSSPNVKLDVYGSIDLSALTTETRSIEIGRGRTDNGYAFIDFTGDATYTDFGLRIIRNNGGSNTNSEIRHRGTGYLQISTAEAAPIQFNTNDTERMRIDSSGNVSVGTTGYATTGGVSILPNNSNSLIRVGHVAGSGSTSYFANFFYDGNQIGSIQQIGTTTVSYVTSSDYRLKENITEITDGITRVKQLSPSRFNFIADPDKTVDGFIAHEVSDIVPEAVSGEKDAVDEEGNILPQGIDQSKLVPLLTAALQESIALIESQQSQIDALTARIESLEATP